MQIIIINKKKFFKFNQIKSCLLFNIACPRITHIRKLEFTIKGQKKGFYLKKIIVFDKNDCEDFENTWVFDYEKYIEIKKGLIFYNFLLKLDSLIKKYFKDKIYAVFYLSRFEDNKK